MPIYEYKCDNGHVFDVMQKLSEDPLSTCVECGAPVKKVLHPVGISFKGSGFYSTDYKNGSAKTSEAAKTNGGKEAGSSDKGAEKPASGTAKSSGGGD